MFFFGGGHSVVVN